MQETITIKREDMNNIEDSVGMLLDTIDNVNVILNDITKNYFNLSSAFLDKPAANYQLTLNYHEHSIKANIAADYTCKAQIEARSLLDRVLDVSEETEEETDIFMKMHELDKDVSLSRDI